MPPIRRVDRHHNLLEAGRLWKNDYTAKGRAMPELVKRSPHR